MATARENDLCIKGYMYPDDEIYKIFEDDDPVYRRIINSPEFRRLKGISFLGTIDVFDLFDTEYKFSRYDHSIGVAVLAKKIAGELSLDKKRTKTLIIACLLHDIGHPPLSHSLEPIFIKYARYRSNGHHTQTRRLIVGNLRYHSKFNLTFLHKMLKDYSINIPEVSSLLGGDGDPILKALLENPFSPDSIDGINRAALTFGEKPVAADDILKSFSLMNSEVVLDLNYKNILDSFWSLKDRIYSRYIYDPKNLMAEHFLCMLFEKIADDVKDLKDLVFMNDYDFLSYLFNHKKIQSILNEVWNSDNFLNSFEVTQNNGSVLISNNFKRALKKFGRVDNKSLDASLINLSSAKKCYIRSYSAVNVPNDTKTLHLLERKIRNNYLLKNGKKVVVDNEQNRIFGTFSGSITKNRFE
jgi:HD superfamily phosphohydrolase